VCKILYVEILFKQSRSEVYVIYIEQNAEINLIGLQNFGFVLNFKVQYCCSSLCAANLFSFQLLRKCILTMTKPTIEGPLGRPPFEKPGIAKAITNFVVYKFGHLAQRVRNRLSIVTSEV
jgi:hypothetical protein